MKFGLYHTTLSGSDGQALQGIIAEGLRVPSGRLSISNQKNGAFFNSHYMHQRSCAEIRIEDPENRKNGKSVIVSIEADLNDTSWTIDYEENAALAKEILFEFQDALCKLTDLEVNDTPNGNFKIIKLESVLSETKDGLNIHYLAKGPETKIIYLPWDKQNLEGVDITEARILEVLRDALAETLGDQFLDQERGAIIESAKENKHGVSLKYSGEKNIPILKAEIFKRPYWEVVFDAEAAMPKPCAASPQLKAQSIKPR